MADILNKITTNTNCCRQHLSEHCNNTWVLNKILYLNMKTMCVKIKFKSKVARTIVRHIKKYSI